LQGPGCAAGAVIRSEKVKVIPKVKSSSGAATSAAMDDVVTRLHMHTQHSVDTWVFEKYPDFPTENTHKNPHLYS